MYFARKRAKLTQSAVQAALSVGQSTLSELERVAHKSGRITEFARLYKVDALWLATGEEEGGEEQKRWKMSLSSDLSDPQVGGDIAHHTSYQPMETVPLISWEQLMSEDPKGAFEFRAVMPDESMAPRVRSGAILHFQSGETPRPGDGVLVRDSTRAVHFREYRAGRPGLWEAHAVNPHYQPMESARDGLTVLGVLTAVGARWG